MAFLFPSTNKLMNKATILYYGIDGQICHEKACTIFSGHTMRMPLGELLQVTGGKHYMDDREAELTTHVDPVLTPKTVLTAQSFIYFQEQH